MGERLQVFHIHRMNQETQIMNSHTLARPRAFLTVLILCFPLLPVGAAQAKSAEEIDASVDAALQSFKKDVKGAEDYLEGAKGVLVMPGVKKAGLVVGAQWGEGALRLGGETVEYYKMQAGSVGFQAGYQDANFVFLFLTQQALDSFRAGKGLAAGVEAGLTVVNASTPALSLDTLKSKSSVVAVAFGKQGLMAGWSAKGTKFSKLSPG
jgi:lipid-binding SYLF domain-containing protein